MRYYGRLYFQDGYWVLDQIEPHVMIKLKAVFTKIPRGQVNPVTLKHTEETASDLKWFISRYPLEMRPEDAKYLESETDLFAHRIRSTEEIFKPDYTFVPPEMKRPPRQDQLVAAELLHRVKRYVLGDVFGKGKTISAYTALMKKETLPALIVVQTHLPSQWKDKGAEFTSLRIHSLKNGPLYTPPEADVYVVKYSQLAKWAHYFCTGIVKTIIFDEIQELRRSESDKYMAAKNIQETCEYVMGLSATPIYNYGDEVWNIYNIVKPGALDTRENFLREWSSDGYRIKDPRALGAYLRDNYLFLRRTRTKEDVAGISPYQTMVERVGHDQQALDEIEELARSLAMRTQSGAFVERGRAYRELDLLVRQATGISKAKYVAQFVRMLVESGEPVLLGGWHRAVYDIWNKELSDLNPVMYTGTESENQKAEAKRKFIEGESNIMILSLRSGAGLDGLQKRCSVAVFGELDWSPQVHEQFIGRLDREGQTNQVMAVYLISDEGSDPGIVEMLGIKSSQASGILDPFGGVQMSEDAQPRVRKLAETYLTKNKAKKEEAEGGCD